VEDAFVAMVEALVDSEVVCINVSDRAAEQRVRGRLSSSGVDPDRGIEFFRIPTDDAWVRDCGPVFALRVRGVQREVAVLDFGFNAWGGKYPPWERDDLLPRRLAEARGFPRFEVGEVLEAGSIDGNGLGTVLTTESCLLNPNRGAGRTRERMEALLRDQLGAQRVLWLGEGIAGDDTDGHVDDLARFVAPGVVACAVEEDPADPNFEPLQENYRRLRGMRDQDEKPLSVVPLPMPRPLVVEGLRCPASYANFYLANRVALVPQFGDPADQRAADILAECLGEGGRQLVPIPCADLVLGLGSVHCLTQQEPG
jgi:agmatine deiminase